MGTNDMTKPKPFTKGQRVRMTAEGKRFCEKNGLKVLDGVVAQDEELRSQYVRIRRGERWDWSWWLKEFWK